jgi:hypothetical protein
LWAGPIKVCGVSSGPPRVEDRSTPPRALPLLRPAIRSPSLNLPTFCVLAVASALSSHTSCMVAAATAFPSPMSYWPRPVISQAEGPRHHRLAPGPDLAGATAPPSSMSFWPCPVISQTEGPRPDKVQCVTTSPD